MPGNYEVTYKEFSLDPKQKACVIGEAGSANTVYVSGTPMTTLNKDTTSTACGYDVFIHYSTFADPNSGIVYPATQTTISILTNNSLINAVGLLTALSLLQAIL